MRTNVPPEQICSLSRTTTDFTGTLTVTRFPVLLTPWCYPLCGHVAKTSLTPGLKLQKRQRQSPNTIRSILQAESLMSLWAIKAADHLFSQIIRPCWQMQNWSMRSWNVIKVINGSPRKLIFPIFRSDWKDCGAFNYRRKYYLCGLNWKQSPAATSRWPSLTHPAVWTAEAANIRHLERF